MEDDPRKLNPTAPALLNRDDDFIQRVLRDMPVPTLIGL